MLPGIYIVLNNQKFILPPSTADQLIFVPIFLAISTGCVGFMQEGEVGENKKIINREYNEIIFSNYKFWPAVQFINFLYVPFNHQVAFNSIVALLWCTYFSFKTNSSYTNKSSEIFGTSFKDLTLFKDKKMFDN